MIHRFIEDIKIRASKELIGAQISKGSFVSTIVSLNVYIYDDDDDEIIE